MIKRLETVNFHLTDFCNYGCKFCFINKENKEVNYDDAIIIIDKIKRYFDHYGLDGRINLVGGEPLCYNRIQDIIDYIYSLGINVSIVTNGYLLTDDFIIRNKNKLYMIGISVDSVDDNTNINIGRCCCNKCLNKERLLHLCDLIKQMNIKLKINTCVMKTNLDEDLSGLIKEINPDRYKIFQVVPDTEFGKLNEISFIEFENYLNKYKGIDYVSETKEYMDDNYLIVDSRGYLTKDNRHTSGDNILNDSEIYDFIK